MCQDRSFDESRHIETLASFGQESREMEFDYNDQVPAQLHRQVRVRFGTFRHPQDNLLLVLAVAHIIIKHLYNIYNSSSDKTEDAIQSSKVNNTMQLFREKIWGHYAAHARNLPWREPNMDGHFDPYRVLVSEVMLQQTQVNRVAPKYQEFLRRFPTLLSLAEASLADVLLVWSGLGYNRRAKYLHEAAKTLLSHKEPWTVDDLVRCKGIGFNTAAAAIVYSYNQPLAFIETNIRTVLIHHFFADKNDVDDKELLPLMEETLDKDHPREWYWALMDYGSYLKATAGNASQASRHYTKQSVFHGSKRQLRGRVLRLLSSGERLWDELLVGLDDERAEEVLTDLLNEGLITRREHRVHLG